MKSNKQRRAEIKAARLRRAGKRYSKLNTLEHLVPKYGIPVDESRLVAVGTMACLQLPLYYMDKSFRCKVCGTKEVWTAKQQKWWYEIAQGAIETTAVKCRVCRKQEKLEKEEQKEHMAEVAKRVSSPNEEFFNKK
ncbi:MAG: zinc-ribbon domain containing protein [Pseudomonadota bacterium]